MRRSRCDFPSLLSGRLGGGCFEHLPNLPLTPTFIRGENHYLTHFLLLAFLLLPFIAAGDVSENIQSASSLMQSGDLQGARKLLQETLAENPQSGPAHLLLGQVALQQLQWEEAETQLKAATTLTTRRPYLPWQLLGRL